MRLDLLSGSVRQMRATFSETAFQYFNLKNGNSLSSNIPVSIHVLRKHKGGREVVSQMLTFAYRGGGGGEGGLLP